LKPNLKRKYFSHQFTFKFLSSLGASYEHYRYLAGQLEEEVNQKTINEDHLKETCEILESQIKELREKEVLLRIKLEEANLSPPSPGVQGLTVPLLMISKSH